MAENNQRSVEVPNLSHQVAKLPCQTQDSAAPDFEAFRNATSITTEENVCARHDKKRARRHHKNIKLWDRKQNRSTQKRMN
ncbi:hypothetical protein SOVF_130470 [Spinacia oleracea]|nr:hypothetical protein SOVF_130470 [Spinacia oleracea]